MRLSLVNVLLVESFCILFLLPLSGSLKCLLSAFVRFTRHGSFIGGKLVALKHNSINGDFHTVFKVHDIADVQVIDVDIFVFGFASLIRARHSHLFTI